MNKFKVGDKVRCIDTSCAEDTLRYGMEYTIAKINDSGLIELKGIDETWHFRFLENRFELIKEDFKADKLGYYKDKRGEIYKGVYIRKDGSLIAIGIKYDLTELFRPNGNYFSYTSDWDLVEYLGTELPKQPREFKFEALIGENKESHRIRDLTDRVFGYHTSALCSGQDLPYLNTFPKISKWEITMKEILE